MNPLSRITLPLLLLAALSGCALPGLIATGTSADELTRKLGKPAETRANPAGGEYWDYVYGPEGTQTWRFAVDGSRKVSGKEQLLTYERLYKVVPGATTEAQVRELLGKPSGISNLAMGPAWDWRIDMPPTKGYFVVNFDRKGVATSIAVLMDSKIDGDQHDR
jgi:outer membrane protein assembly factor BamE (lipoprotein component of BamABCDE complex)